MATNNLKYYRRKKGLTQAKLAKMADIAEQYYQKLEYGKSKPGHEVAQRLATALGVPAEI